MSEKEIEIALDKHKQKMTELKICNELINGVILADHKLVKFANQLGFNYLWVQLKLKEVNRKFFIFTAEQFLEFLNDPDHIIELTRLFKVLSKIKFIRAVNEKEYLICELFNVYIEFSNRYRIDSFEYFDKYAYIDALSVPEAIEYYHEQYLEDPIWFGEAYCDYYGYEHCDTFSISHA